MWAGLLNFLPENIDWMIGAGLLPPTVDPLKQKQELLEAKAEAARAAKEAKRGGGRGGETGPEAGGAEEKVQVEDDDAESEAGSVSEVRMSLFSLDISPSLCLSFYLPS